MADYPVMLNTFPTFVHQYRTSRPPVDDLDDEALPLRVAPNPSLTTPQRRAVSATFDPALCITPDKRAQTTTLVELRRPASSLGEDFTQHVPTKVHFDQTVAVHHLSPDIQSSIIGGSPEVDTDRLAALVSPPAQPEAHISAELDLSNLSDVEPISIIASDLRRPSPLTTTGSVVSSTASTSDAAPSNAVKNVTYSSKPSSSSVGSSANRSTRGVLKSASTAKKASVIITGVGERKKELKKERRQDKTTSPVVVAEFGGTQGSLTNAFNCQSVVNEPSQCVLAKPEFNSTLRLSQEIALVGAQQFDLDTVIRDKIDPKLKLKAVEKASQKVNADGAMYPDLISLQVSEDDLLNHLTDEQLNRLKPTDFSADKDRPEDKISKVPDVMDFFTSDLHKESASVTLVSIPGLRLQPRTAELSQAFELYRHIRTWEKL